MNKGEIEELKKDVFYISIKAFSEDQSLLDEFIQKPPDWLKKIENEEEKKDHLREKVLIKIFERFEFNIHEEFEGYKVTLPD